MRMRKCVPVTLIFYFLILYSCGPLVINNKSNKNLPLGCKRRVQRTVLLARHYCVEWIDGFASTVVEGSLHFRRATGSNTVII